MQELDRVCGLCGAPFVVREVAPCLDCGGDERELEDLQTGHHTYARFRLLGDDFLCDFCDADMPGGDLRFWGFPRDFSWTDATAGEEFDFVSLPPSGNSEPACSRCHNTLRKQTFIRNNARRNGVQLPKEYWPFLAADE